MSVTCWGALSSGTAKDWEFEWEIWMGNNLQTEKWNLPLSESLTSWLLGGNTNCLSSWVLFLGWLEWKPSAPSLMGASCSELVLIIYILFFCVFLETTWKKYILQAFFHWFPENVVGVLLFFFFGCCWQLGDLWNTISSTKHLSSDSLRWHRQLVAGLSSLLQQF